MPEVRVRCGAPIADDFRGSKGTPVVVDEETGDLYVMLVDGSIAKCSGGGGEPGPAGPQGPAGQDGAQGPQGLQGVPGNDGAQGPQGTQGPAGADGSQGPQGIQGVKGDTGDAGLQGIPGNDGAPGAQGEQGPQGIQGPAGTDGADGVGVPAGGTSGQVLAKASNADHDTAWVTPQAGGSGMVSVRMTQDVANATVNLANATGLSFAAAANSDYIIDANILWDTSGTTVGIKLSADFSSTGHTIAGQWIVNVANGTLDGAAFNADDGTVTTTASPFTTSNHAKLWAILRTGANAGTFVVRFAAETTGTITIKTGSVLRYEKTL